MPSNHLTHAPDVDVPGGPLPPRTTARLAEMWQLLRLSDRRSLPQLIGEQLWAEKRYLGLRCDLQSLPERRRAKIEVIMQAASTQTFRGFCDELGRVSGPDAYQVMLRIHSCEAQIQTLYVAMADERPIYAQWLITATEQAALLAHSPGSYQPLLADEVLLEGAYTFLQFRRMGVMADGMAQLLEFGRAKGAGWAITYVADDNIASLRGCAQVGFQLDHLRLSRRRLGLRRSRTAAVDQAGRNAWLSATDGLTISPRPARSSQPAAGAAPAVGALWRHAAERDHRTTESTN